MICHVPWNVTQHVIKQCVLPYHGVIAPQNIYDTRLRTVTFRLDPSEGLTKIRNSEVTVFDRFEFAGQLLGNEGAVCMFGVITLLFHYVLYLVDSQPEAVDEAFLYHSLLDSFVSGSHPDLVDKSRWGIRSESIVNLRHRILDLKFQAKHQQRVQTLTFEAQRRAEAAAAVAANWTQSQPAVVSGQNQDEHELPEWLLFDEKPPKVFVYDLWSAAKVRMFDPRSGKGALVEHNRNNKPQLENVETGQEAGFSPLYSLSQGSSFCSRGQWGMEVTLHDFLLQSDVYRTLDPHEADFFFVPGYGICIFESGMLQLPQITDVYRDLVARELPFFRGHERRHVFTFGSGMGINVLLGWKEILPDSIFLTPEPSLYNDFPQITKPPFRTWQHIVIPGQMHRQEITSLSNAARPLKDRTYTGVFFGRVDPSRGVHPEIARTDPTAKDVRNQLVKLMQGNLFTQEALMADVEQNPSHMVLGRDDELVDQGAAAVDAPAVVVDPAGSAPQKKKPEQGSQKAGVPTDGTALHRLGMELGRDAGDGNLDPDALVYLLETKQALGGIDLNTTKTDDFYVGYVSLDKMHELMGSSRFCFVPRGKSAWSLRFFESLIAECIPVLLSDMWELPFEDFIDYSGIVVKWPAHRITPKLLYYLRSIPDVVVDRMMRRIRELRCWWMYPSQISEIHGPLRENRVPLLCPREGVEVTVKEEVLEPIPLPDGTPGPDLRVRTPAVRVRRRPFFAFDGIMRVLAAKRGVPGVGAQVPFFQDSDFRWRNQELLAKATSPAR